jgi:hypothetical protein
MSSSSKSQTFLWVNESSLSQPRKPGTASSTIRQHVQQARKRGSRHKEIEVSAATKTIVRDGWHKLDTSVELDNAGSPYELAYKDADGGLGRPMPTLQRLGFGAAAWKGNSDPFGSYPITITPRVNNVLSFIRDEWLPAEFLTKTEIFIRMTLSRIEWSDITQCLSSEDSAYALLSMYATLLARRSPNAQALRYSLYCKHQGLTSLRAWLSGGKGIPRDSISRLAGVTFLLGAAICDDNMAEAEFHVRALKQLFDNRDAIPTGSTEHNVFLRALRFDVRLALVRLSPTIFDMESHAQHLLRRTFGFGSRFFQNFPNTLFTSPMDCYLSEPLRTLIVRTRQVFWLWQHQDLDIHNDDMVILSHWVRGDHYIIQGSLINYFAKTRAKLRGSDKNTILLAVELCLSLGLLCVHNNPRMTGESTHDCTAVLLQCLQELLVYFEEVGMGLSREDFKSKNAVLWSLFIGTILSRWRRIGAPNTLNEWFSQKLAIHVSTMRLTTWQEVREQLSLLLYFDEMTPFLSNWFITCVDVRHENDVEGTR